MPEDAGRPVNGNGNGDNPQAERPALPAERALEMDSYARSLGLSPTMQRFALELVAQPHLSATEAYKRAAGSKSGRERPAHVAWKLTHNPRVQKYMQALRAVVYVRPALAVANGDSTALQVDRTLATQEEVLRGATTLARAKLGNFIDERGEIVVRRVKRAPAGVVKRYRTITRKRKIADDVEITEVTREIELVDGLAAHALLGRFLGMERPKGPRKVVFNVKALLRGLPDELLRKVHEASGSALEKTG